MEKTWTVVKFTEEDAVEAVPTGWLQGNKCFWPPLPQQKLLISIKNNEAANSNWPQHEISFFKDGTFDSYLEARQKCKVAEYQSDLMNDTDDLKKRKDRNKKPISSSSSDDEGTLCDPPQRKKYIQKKTSQMNPVVETVPTPTIEKNTSDDDTVLKLREELQIFSNNSQKKFGMLTAMMADLLAEMKSLREEIKLKSFTSHSPDSTESVFEKLKLPATTTEEMEEIEAFLSLPDNFMRAALDVAKLGGNSAFDFVKRSMLQFITYSFATSYTWLGTKEKKAFNKTKLSKLIIRASEKISNAKEIEEALQKFFRRAKERSNAKSSGN